MRGKLGDILFGCQHTNLPNHGDCQDGCPHGSTADHSGTCSNGFRGLHSEPCHFGF